METMNSLKTSMYTVKHTSRMGYFVRAVISSGLHWTTFWFD